ncbi:MAG: hypothetical protein A3K09_06850 [Nitrospinae bacterium RIFCSPLOWO2_12_FULL_47_7]|nr:MAG: hypothetical protein A3K09_06850 [Nitrospinae bacterium RIFCSPLOWO2_12_FULL_47_7]
MRHRITLILLGILSFGLYIGLTGLAREFNWGEGYLNRPIPTYLALYFTLFILYAGAATLVLKRLDDQASLWIILAFGLLFRAAIFPSQQIQEDDIYRYLWDGKVFAHGINPYEYPPKLVSRYKSLQIRDPEEFQRLYDERNSRELELLYRLKWENPTALSFLERVNHPDIPTIYPPLAQYVFRIVHWLRPDSILAMRSMFLLFDLTALTFIILTLNALGKNRNLCIIYFWSPLLIKETFNSTHLDILGVSFLCVSLYCYVRANLSAAILFLALSVLGKLYPIILLPLYLKRMTRNIHLLVLNLSLFTAIIGIFYLPFLNIGMKAFAGLGAYASRWENNDSLFAILLYLFSSIPGLQSASFLSGNIAAFLCKATVALILLTVLLYLLAREREEGSLNDMNDIFIMLGLVFLLSPVQNPWYLVWIVPFLCFFPGKSWILLTCLAGLYYLGFYFDYQEIKQYKPWIPWFEYPLFYYFLAAETGLIKRLKDRLIQA